MVMSLCIPSFFDNLFERHHHNTFLSANLSSSESMATNAYQGNHSKTKLFANTTELCHAVVKPEQQYFRRLDLLRHK